MARFGKYTFVIYLLSALAALELIALAAVLAGPAVPAAAAAETAAAPEQMPAWLEPAPQREELPEEKDRKTHPITKLRLPAAFSETLQGPGEERGCQ